MRDWQSQSHMKGYCKYHVVFVPKYRRRAIYGNLRKKIGGILRDLCQEPASAGWPPVIPVPTGMTRGDQLVSVGFPAP